MDAIEPTRRIDESWNAERAAEGPLRHRWRRTIASRLRPAVVGAGVAVAALLVLAPLSGATAYSAPYLTNGLSSFVRTSGYGGGLAAGTSYCHNLTPPPTGCHNPPAPGLSAGEWHNYDNAWIINPGGPGTIQLALTGGEQVAQFSATKTSYTVVGYWSWGILNTINLTCSSSVTSSGTITFELGYGFYDTSSGAWSTTTTDTPYSLTVSCPAYTSFIIYETSPIGGFATTSSVESGLGIGTTYNVWAFAYVISTATAYGPDSGAQVCAGFQNDVSTDANCANADHSPHTQAIILTAMTLT